MSVETVTIILLSVAAGSVVKGLSGLGLPLVAIPLMAGFLGAEHSVVLMTIPGLMVNGWLMWTNRQYATVLPNLPLVCVAGVAGAVSGAWLLAHVADRWLFLLMALALGSYLLIVATGRQPQLNAVWGRRLAAPLVLFSGLMQGSTGISGPVVAPYVHAMRLEKGAYLFMISALFQAFGVIQVVTIAFLGLYTTERVLEGLFACLPVLVVMPLALRLSNRFTPRGFEAVVVTVLVLMELRLVWKVVV